MTPTPQTHLWIYLFIYSVLSSLPMPFERILLGFRYSAVIFMTACYQNAAVFVSFCSQIRTKKRKQILAKTAKRCAVKGR